MIPQGPVVSIFALTGLFLLTTIIHLPYHASENLTPNSSKHLQSTHKFWRGPQKIDGSLCLPSVRNFKAAELFSKVA
jgi:hypothetical protein